jgi:hypothetical protein
MGVESQRMDDEQATSQTTEDDVLRSTDQEIRPEDVGATPHTSPPTSMSERTEAATGDADRDEGFRDPLLPEERTAGYRDRWEEIQSRFVDDPQSSVEQADTLVIEVVQELQTMFGSERNALEAQWQRGDDVQTEDLRVALQRYRAFFDRLLSA